MSESVQTEPLPVLPIEYEPPQRTVRPMSRAAALWVLGLAFVPTVIGVGILILYGLTALEPLPMAGIFWLGIGGLMTFVIGVISVVNLVRSVARRPKEPVIVWRYVIATVACGLAVAAAYGCLHLGAKWVEMPRFQVTVRNDTPTPIDRVVVHFTGGDMDAGPVGPGATVNAGIKWVQQRGPVDITTTINGKSRRMTDRLYDAWGPPGGSPVMPFDIIVEPSELPKVTP
ncbi:MAG TPA: hypothetical protein VF595_11280 [Tepidisphaeraceae bacterium]